MSYWLHVIGVQQISVGVGCQAINALCLPQQLQFGSVQFTSVSHQAPLSSAAAAAAAALAAKRVSADRYLDPQVTLDHQCSQLAAIGVDGDELCWQAHGRRKRGYAGDLTSDTDTPNYLCGDIDMYIP